MNFVVAGLNRGAVPEREQRQTGLLGAPGSFQVAADNRSCRRVGVDVLDSDLASLAEDRKHLDAPRRGWLRPAKRESTGQKVTLNFDTLTNWPKHKILKERSMVPRLPRQAHSCLCLT